MVATEQPSMKQGWDVDTLLDRRAAPVQPVCQKCSGTGQVEEGGVYPSGDLAYVPCECTAPPSAQRQWVGLTAGERDALFTQHYQWDDYGKAIETKLMEKNT
jgi:hypothetical protein